MKRELEIEITNLFGSAEYPRQVTVSKPKITRTKKKSMKRSDTDIQVNTATDEQQTEESQENVNSFNMAGGKPTIRLGGAYGKLQGLLKEAGLTLATAGEPEFTKTGVLMIVPTIQIFPEFCELEMDGSQMHEVKGLVTVNSRFGGRGTQKPTIWDVIPKATTRITVIYPDPFDSEVIKMFRMAENLNFAERRRGKIKIIEGLE